MFSHFHYFIIIRGKLQYQPCKSCLPKKFKSFAESGLPGLSLFGYMHPSKISSNKCFFAKMSSAYCVLNNSWTHVLSINLVQMDQYNLLASCIYHVSSLQIFISKSNTLDMDMTFALNKMNSLNMDMTFALYHCWASHLHQHLSRASTYWKSESPWVISGDSLIILQHSNATFYTETSCGKMERYVLKMF